MAGASVSVGDVVELTAARTVLSERVIDTTRGQVLWFDDTGLCVLGNEVRLISADAIRKHPVRILETGKKLPKTLIRRYRVESNGGADLGERDLLEKAGYHAGEPSALSSDAVPAVRALGWGVATALVGLAVALVFWPFGFALLAIAILLCLGAGMTRPETSVAVIYQLD